MRAETDLSVAIWAFLLLLAIVTGSGALSWLRKRHTPEDYLVAGRDVPPWLSSLSAVSTNNSGFMFIGMIAFTYRSGIEAIWMMLGWIGGDLLVWLFIHGRVRRMSERLSVNTFEVFLGTRKDETRRGMIAAAGMVTLIFLGVYAAAQLKAGSTALHALFGWDMWGGALIGTGIVILYSFAGGIRADIWTDAAQSAVMIGVMAMILVAGHLEIGGWRELMAALSAQDPALTRLFPDDLAFGLAGFVLGFAFAGLGVSGQPHLVVRLMAIDSPDSIRRAGFFYFLWYIPFFLASIGVGLYGRALVPDLLSLPVSEGLREPTELALPILTMELLPDVFVGVALAGLFAATISTADSQIIVCSGAITHALRPAWQDSYLASKLATLTVTAWALAIALFAPEGVFGLVLIAWSALGAGLGPLLMLRVFRAEPGSGVAIAMMVTGVGVVAAWYLAGYGDDLLQILPGMLAAFAVYGAARLAGLGGRSTSG